jgi:hypothetical protein
MDTDSTFIGGSNPSSFFSYMFSMTDGEKIDVINTLQYLVLAIIPILLVIKLMNNYIPPFDSKKSTVEMAVELVVQLTVLLALFFFVHKLILFFPTYTKQAYPNIQFLTIVLPLLFILFNLDKNFGEKAQLLIDRLLMMVGIKKENFEGADLEEEEKNQQNVNKNVNSQVSNQQMMPPQMSNPSTMMLEPTVKKSDRETPKTQQYGINQYNTEPVAANDSIGYSMF